jgi:acetyl esterase/lipase
VIAPDYPLGPEGNYKDIVDSIRDFLLWYKHDLFFKTPEQNFVSWTEWIKEVANIARIESTKTSIYVTGESAGGHAAMTALFLNADNDLDIKLHINVALLRYPMLKHYSRSSMPPYMGVDVTKEGVMTQVRMVEEEILLLERYGLVPSRTQSPAPTAMAFAYLLSTSQRWTPVFQRKHGPYDDKNSTPPGATQYPFGWPTDRDAEENWDCLERAEKSVNKVAHNALPPVLMYQGQADSACPIENTRDFRDLLTKHYPGQYHDGTAHLEEVTFVDGRVTDVNHGFDYILQEAHNPWLAKTHEEVNKYW